MADPLAGRFGDLGAGLLLGVAGTLACLAVWARRPGAPVAGLALAAAGVVALAATGPGPAAAGRQRGGGVRPRPGGGGGAGGAGRPPAVLPARLARAAGA